VNFEKSDLLVELMNVGVFGGDGGFKELEFDWV
jgi:hypothetical protein